VTRISASLDAPAQQRPRPPISADRQAIAQAVVCERSACRDVRKRATPEVAPTRGSNVCRAVFTDWPSYANAPQPMHPRAAHSQECALCVSPLEKPQPFRRPGPPSQMTRGMPCTTAMPARAAGTERRLRPVRSAAASAGAGPPTVSAAIPVAPPRPARSSRTAGPF